jgi:hypothetical protein
MKRRLYSWAGVGNPKGVVKSTGPQDALPVGPTMTDDERKAWRALWSDRLARGVDTVNALPRSVLHSRLSDCPGKGCPNRVHAKERWS